MFDDDRVKSSSEYMYVHVTRDLHDDCTRDFGWMIIVKLNLKSFCNQIEFMKFVGYDISFFFIGELFE